MAPGDLSTSTGTAAPRLGRSVSLDQAAQLLGVCRRTIYNRIRDGRLQTIRTPGGSQRVLLDSFRTLVTGASDNAAGKTGKPIER
jgi:excisionase family DNA binding protein